MSDDSVTLILARLDTIEARLDSFEHRFEDRRVLAERDQSRGERIGHLEKLMDKVEEERRWLNRIVIASVVASVLALVTGAPVFG